MTTLSHQTFSDRTLSLRSAVSASPASGFEQSLAQASLRRVEEKELLFAEGDENPHVDRIETGAIALFRVLADGRRQVMGFADPGDMIVLGMEKEHEMDAQAVKAILFALPAVELDWPDRCQGPDAGLQAGTRR